MSQKSVLSQVYNNSASGRLNAMRDYLEVIGRRNQTRKSHAASYAEEGLVKLGPYMPGLAANPDLTLLDKKFFYMLYINLLKDVGDINAAVNCSEAALKLDPDDVKTISQHVALLKKLERYDEATELLEKGVAKNPGDIFLLTALADTHSANGDYEMAKDCYRRATFINPRDRLARERLEMLEAKPF